MEWWDNLRNSVGDGLSNLGNYISGRPKYGTDIIGGLQGDVDLAYNPDSMLFTNEMGQNSFNIGLINLDFADIRAVMSEMGKAMMGTGEADGERRALDAAEDMYDFQKNLASTNLYNQAKMINNRYKTAALASAGLQGATDSQGRITTPSQSSIDAANQRAESKYVRSYI